MRSPAILSVSQEADSIGSALRAVRPCISALGPKWLVRAARKQSAAKVEAKPHEKEWLIRGGTRLWQHPGLRRGRAL